MTTFAHIETGFALDPQLDATIEDYRKRFTSDVIAAWAILQVPDSTRHGAKDNGDGTYTNPTTAVSVAPRVLEWGALAAYLIGLLGGGTTGRAALGAIIKACQASAAGGDNFFAVYFTGQTVFTKAEFTGVLADVATGIVSTAQKNAVSSNWPV